MPRELPYPEVDIDEVREYVQARTERSSVRAMAAEIGMRHTTLAKFLEGSAPYPKNRILIVEWYLRQGQALSASGRMDVPARISEHMQAHLEATDPESHLDVLLADLRGEARGSARRSIVAALAQGYRKMGRQAPRWLYRA